MNDFGEALRAAIEEGDLAHFGRHLLQRARLDVDLSEIAGRPAILAWLNSLAAAFDGPRLHDMRQIEGPGIVAIDCRVEGHAGSVPGIGPLPEPLLSASLNLRLWARLEGARAVELTAIADWSQILGPAGLDAEGAARTLGGAAPCHRPLGELASGLGQLGTDAAGTGWVADFNARRAMGSAAQRQQVRTLLARMPDARLLLDQALDTGDGDLLLLRLQGHVAGRRVSLPASKVVGGQWDAGGSEPLRVDSLALAATAHRPFHPD
jgi:hypothetical protein